MAKASSAVASITQQSRQRVPQSCTDYRERRQVSTVQTEHVIYSLRVSVCIHL